MIQTANLLNQLVASFPRRKADLEKMLAEMGIDEPQPFTAEAPEPLTAMPTFDRKSSQPLSPMLRERFEAFGAIVQGPEVWLAGPAPSLVLDYDEIISLHESLRNHWENSLPARFGDHELSLFGYTPDVYDEAVYLAWTGSAEPIVAEYKSGSAKQFDCLDDYLLWKINRP